ncbi:MAG: hypothetical protein CM15mP65_25320 [Crocinitomicaceae bacterium]|nr:MAG: hypothetical protein CM15mP65_25320 [Crocinitomicaceae bacterium]
MKKNDISYCIVRMWNCLFLRSIRAASQGGNEIDFHASEALKMAAQTAKGAASLLLENNSHPEDEIDKVTISKRMYYCRA